MKTKAKGLFTVGLLSVYFGMSAVMAAPIGQVAPATDSKPLAEGGTRTPTGQLKVSKSTTVARNSTVKPEPIKADVVATTAPAKEQDKKTMSRCWKRLMIMARELNHAHRTKSK